MEKDAMNGSGSERRPGKREVKAVLLPVEGPARRIVLESDERGSVLGALQDQVHGLIDVFNVIEGAPDLIVNDEGLFSEPPNRAVYATRSMEEMGYLSQIDGHPVKRGDLYAILFGPIVAVGHDEEGETVDVDLDAFGRIVESGHLGPERSGIRELCALSLGSR